MRFVSTYRFQPFRTKEQTRQLLALFAEVGNAPGVTEHFAFVDGTGGIVIGETDDIAGLYRNVVSYREFLTVETHLVLRVEEAVGETLAVVAE